MTVILESEHLASVPRRCNKNHIGEIHVPIHIGDTLIRDGEWLYADSDGILISKTKLSITPSKNQEDQILNVKYFCKKGWRKCPLDSSFIQMYYYQDFLVWHEKKKAEIKLCIDLIDDAFYKVEVLSATPEW